MKITLEAGVLYFAVVFAAGFVLGTIRTLWVVPRLGVRTAELIEAPIMFGISILAARWVVRNVQGSPLRSRRLAIGMHRARPHARCRVQARPVDTWDYNSRVFCCP